MSYQTSNIPFQPWQEAVHNSCEDGREGHEGDSLHRAVSLSWYAAVVQHWSAHSLWQSDALCKLSSLVGLVSTLAPTFVTPDWLIHGWDWRMECELCVLHTCRYILPSVHMPIDAQLRQTHMHEHNDCSYLSEWVYGWFAEMISDVLGFNSPLALVVYDAWLKNWTAIDSNFLALSTSSKAIGSVVMAAWLMRGDLESLLSNPLRPYKLWAKRRDAVLPVR